MAKPIRASTQLPFLYPPRCFASSRRTFAATTQQAAGGRSARASTTQRPSLQKSFKVAMQEMMKKGDISNDLGLLPDTFVMPTGANIPSAVFAPRERARVEWHRLKKRMTDFFSVVVYWRMVPKPRPKFGFWNKARTAQVLHTQMYSAFAEGDKDALANMCADGLLRNFEGRISQRPTSERLEWTLHKHLGKPRVVSHRAAPLPEVEGLGIRQAIVRIRSRQSLQRSSQKAAGFEPVVQDKEEYIVIQKRMFEKMEGPWMVWGTVEESDWRKVVL